MNKEKRKIKLVIAINDFLVGGAQRLIAELLPYFDKTRFDIEIITLMNFEGRDTMYHLIPKYIMVHRLDFKGFADLRGWMALYNLLRRIKPDVVLSHLFFTNMVVRILNIFIKYKTITVEHNTYIGNRRWQIWSDRILSVYSKKIVAVSPAVMDFAARQQHVSSEKFVLIRNGLDTHALTQKVANIDKAMVRDELGLKPDDKIVIVVGRLTGQKKPILLIEGFARFVKSHQNYHLVILGDGALRRECERRSEDLGISRRTHFLGNVSDVMQYYGVSEFLLSTSEIEGLSMAHLEALACGVPILATHTAGSNELITEGQNGFFIKDRTPEAVETGLMQMYQTDIKTMREGAHQTAKRYDIKDTASRYEKLILSV